MLASVLICYAIVLQSLFGSLASASSTAHDSSAFLTVICHSDNAEGDTRKDPARDVAAKHHCVLCETGSVSPALPAPAIETAASLIDRRSATVLYVEPQDAAAAPLFLPRRVSRGPPHLA